MQASGVQRKRRVVAIDFDKTLRTHNDAPIERVVAFAQRCFDAFDFVVVYTARPEADRTFVTTWLMRNDVRFDAVVMGKLRFDVLVDDRAVRPEEV